MNNLYRQGSLANLALNKKDILAISGNFNKENFEDFDYIDGVSTLDIPLPNKLIFLDDFSSDIQNQINLIETDEALLILPKDFIGKTNKPTLFTDYPRDLFAKLVTKLFRYDETYWNQDGLIDSSAEIDISTKIMSNVSVGPGVKIGKNCLIYPNVVIGPNCVLGDEVIIKSNTVIGQAGFGIYRDKDGLNRHLPHVGAVIIEDYVEIGALNTVVAGTIHPTVVESFVKTDDHVHIAHNDYISKGVQIAAHALLSGSVFVGENAWLGPNITIIDHVKIGKESFIGSGTNIVKEVSEGATVVGNPGKKIR